MARSNMRGKERVKRAAYGILFILIALYSWVVLEANKFPGIYWLILTVPIYLATITLLECFTGYCVLKNKEDVMAKKLHLASLAITIVIVLIIIFVLLPGSVSLG